jgi:hypothetical protein
MIVVRLSGGLGNQLFQYATARGLSARNGGEVVLDRSWFEGTHWRTTARTYELDRYPLVARPIADGDVRFLPLYRHPLLKRVPLPRWTLCGLELVRETHPGFDPRVASISDNAYLDGYWQSPRYFEHIADAIRRELTPTAPMTEADRRVAERMAASQSVAVHVRRGDYVSLPAAARAHGALSLDYYRAAVQRIRERVADPRFFVFSDDPSWTRDHLDIEAAEHVTHNGPSEAFRDLRLMARCSHQIVANSSLSWWAGWLNANPEKTVIAPQPWFVRGDPSDLVPDSWTRIPSSGDRPAGATQSSILPESPR